MTMSDCLRVKFTWAMEFSDKCLIRGQGPINVSGAFEFAATEYHRPPWSSPARRWRESTSLRCSWPPQAPSRCRGRRNTFCCRTGTSSTRWNEISVGPKKACPRLREHIPAEAAGTRDRTTYHKPFWGTLLIFRVLRPTEAMGLGLAVAVGEGWTGGREGEGQGCEA